MMERCPTCFDLVDDPVVINQELLGREYVICRECYETFLDCGEITICRNCGGAYDDELIARAPDFDDFHICPYCAHDVFEGGSFSERLIADGGPKNPAEEMNYKNTFLDQETYSWWDGEHVSVTFWVVLWMEAKNRFGFAMKHPDQDVDAYVTYYPHDGKLVFKYRVVNDVSAYGERWNVLKLTPAEKAYLTAAVICAIYEEEKCTPQKLVAEGVW